MSAVILYLLFFTCCLTNSVKLSNAQSCPPYETPVECVNQCQTCEYKNIPCFQPAVCIPGCNCIDGYYRDKQGNCVPGDLCDICGLNEVYSECVDICNTCEIITSNSACNFFACNVGCDCRQGFTRNDQMQCVPVSQCSSANCGINEEYSKCVNICNTCEIIKSNSACNFLLCNEGCDCKPGYTRNDRQRCILESVCTAECPLINCIAPCNIDNNNKPCPRCVCPGDQRPCPQVRCTAQCPLNENAKPCPKCECKDPPKKCGKNEAIVRCAKPKWCNTCLIRGLCKLTSCSEGCDCKPRFYRDDKGVCIPQSQCPERPCPQVFCTAECPLNENAKPCPKCECKDPSKS